MVTILYTIGRLNLHHLTNGISQETHSERLYQMILACRRLVPTPAVAVPLWSYPLYRFAERGGGGGDTKSSDSA